MFKFQTFHNLWDAFQCYVCANVYDPNTGDAEQGVPPKTPLAKVPDSWRCPGCNASTAMYKPVTNEV